MVVLNGVEYNHTSVAAEQGGIAFQTGGRIGWLTPHLVVGVTGGSLCECALRRGRHDQGTLRPVDRSRPVGVAGH